METSWSAAHGEKLVIFPWRQAALQMQVLPRPAAISNGAFAKCMLAVSMTGQVWPWHHRNAADGVIIGDDNAMILVTAVHCNAEGS